MKGLLLKDFYCLKQYMRQYLFVLLFLGVLSVLLKSPSYLMIMGMVCSMSLIFASIGTEDNGGFLYSMTLPVSRRMIVKEKFLFLLILAGALFCISVAGSLAVMACIGFFSGENLTEWVVQTLSVTWIYLIIDALIVPAALKWRTERARFFILGIIAVPVAFILILGRIVGGEGLNILIERLFRIGNGMLAMGIGVLILLAVYGGAYLASLHIFSKREF
ncbi:MAG: ABC-2 transporter permease [Ruminococcus sp.]|jgi:ABC-2 type transport system permease protein